ncbi:death-inducer obliterator 1 isoform X2 [Euwallacea fornicatus]|uniref:death-inducer obliterator 1 isoform X2 n=1 Tax=Euwallacea fornicatus TaxID=995702 RepID=UPI00338E9BAC
MANSVVKVTDVTDDSISDSLLLLIGKDGTVTPDKQTVENYLSSKSGPTNLQIMQIGKGDENQKGIDVIVDNVMYIPDNMEVANEEAIFYTGDITSVSRNLRNIQLDHDYTPLTSLKEPLSPAEEDDELAKTLSILHGSEESAEAVEAVVVPSNAPRGGIKIISSITIPAQNNAQSLSTSSTSSLKEKSGLIEQKVLTPKPKGKVKILHTSPKAVQRKRGRPKKVVPKLAVSEPEDSDEEDDDMEDEDEESEEEDFSLAFEDDENDSDFDIKEEITGKKGKKGLKRGKRQKILNEFSPKETAIKGTKMLKKTKKKGEVGKESEEFSVKTTGTVEKTLDSEQPEVNISDKTESDKIAGKSDGLLAEKNEKAEEKKEVKPPEKKPPKKKKEPPKPIPGDFALFSTPDIIRKVSGKEPGTPQTPETAPTTKSLKTADQNKTPNLLKFETPGSSKPGKICPESRSKQTTEILSKSSRSSVDEKHHTHHHRSSTEVRNKDRRDSVEKPKHFKSVEEKSSKLEHSVVRTHHHDRRRSDFNSDSSKTSLKLEHQHSKLDDSSSKSSQESNDESISEDIPSAQDIRAIIMNDETRTYTTNTTAIPDVPIHLNNTADSDNLSLAESGLDLDQSILDNINNDMISEDILYQVAKQLVSNTELQNAIDKGINDGVLDTSGIQEAMDMSSQVSESSNTSTSESQQGEIIKQGKQIVRPDGRILVLPPIERPTTRSRNKRKEEPVKPKPCFKQPTIKVDNRNKERTVHKPLDDEHVSGNELDSSGDEEEESEDDPNKLWCICNQPHNNRFMICCDTCEEWYHGKCVNITKGMGQQMESEGKEWICLFCMDPSLKRPKAAARRIRKASHNSRQSTDSNNSAKKSQKERGTTSAASAVPCVVCQKPSRKSSIYCSENCILAHAQGIERVVVFERTTGKMLTGAKAPSATNLDQWLKQHPGYEVVKSAGKVVTTKARPGQLTQSKLKLVKNSNNDGVSVAVQQRGVNVGIMAHAPKHSPQSSSTPKRFKIITITHNKDSAPKDSKIKLIQPQPLQPSLNLKEQTPKKIQVQTILTPILPSIPVPKTPKKETPKKETPKEAKPKTPKAKTPKEDAQTPQAKAEDIRDNVQKTVFEQLIVRLKGSEIKLTEDEVKNISIEIEAELFKCFGDIGQKYKNKYRSLIFNIKDAKNQTLWRRICERSISSYELVRLSPDDMASQELAKWREQEAKHQLDMIKKSEIELLNCNRQYVLKTHKGEEVLEDRPSTITDNTDIIKSLTEGSTLDMGADPKLLSKDRDKNKDKRGSSKNQHKDKMKELHSGKERREKNKEHKSRRSSSREVEKGRKRSRSRDRSRHKEKKKDKRSRSGSRETERSRDRDKNKEKEKEKHRNSAHKSSRHKKHETISSTDSLDKRSKEILEQLNKIAPPVETRLWEHVSQEDIALVGADTDSDHEVPSSTVMIPTPPRIQDAEDFPSQSSDDSKLSTGPKDVETEDEPPISPQSRKSPTEMWTGTINMVDVAQIAITAHEVSGDCSGLNKELSANLDIVGRISPDTVWDYIGKMRSSNSKIISLIRLNATNMEEQMPYLALYSYLSSRNRLGVVKSTNKAIKDFYILPLAAQKPIPQALLPLNGPVKQWLEASVKKINDLVQNGFEEARPALLLGIIVRDRRKRPHGEPVPSHGTSHKKNRIEGHVVQNPPLRSYTPPPVPPEVVPAPLPPLPPAPKVSSRVPKVDPRLAKFNQPPPLAPELPESPPTSGNTPAFLSPLMSLVTPPQPVPPPIAPKQEPLTPNDDDEPYSPEDSDPDTTATETPSVLTATTAISINSASITTESYVPIPGLGDDTHLSAKKMDIQRQMEELNKQIEMQKCEITSITKNIATAESKIVGSALASIALPSNLQQILDSIKTIGSTSVGESVVTAVSPVPAKEPPPTAGISSDLTIPLMIPKSFSRPLASSHDIPNTIPLNLPNKSKLTPPFVASPEEKIVSDPDKPSVLSSLSEEDLIRKAAEMLKESPEEKSSKRERSPAPRPSKSEKKPISFSIAKRPKSDVALPPLPGMDD